MVSLNRHFKKSFMTGVESVTCSRINQELRSYIETTTKKICQYICMSMCESEVWRKEVPWQDYAKASLPLEGPAT